MRVLIAASAWWLTSAIPWTALAQGPTSSNPVHVVPERIDFGGVAPGETIEFSFQLVNDSEQSIAALAVRPNCDCTKPIGFQPRGLFPGETLTIDAQITAPDVVGETKGAMLLVMLKDGQIVPCSLRIEAIDPRIRCVQRYSEEYEAWGQSTAQKFVSFDARKWFLTREGDGAEFFARGAWADWDEFFNSTHEVVSVELEGDEVVVTAIEHNDFYRLIEREPSPTLTRYWFDDENKILGKVFLGRPDGAPEPEDRLDEFLAWLGARDPKAVEELMPGGEFDPVLDKAKRWRELLMQWREDQGLEPALPADE